MNNIYPDIEIRIKIHDKELYNKIIERKHDHTPFTIHTKKAEYHIKEIFLADTELYDIHIDNIKSN